MPFIQILTNSELDKLKEEQESLKEGLLKIPVAYVYENDKLTDLIVCINIDENAEDEKLYELSSDNHYTFKPYFYKPKNTGIACCIFGPRGSGKSHVLGEILDNEFQNVESKDIFIFSRKDYDEPLDRPRICKNQFNQVLDIAKTEKNLKKGIDKLVYTYVNKKGDEYVPIRLDPYDPEVQMTPTEKYHNSYMIFDDVELMKDKHATIFLHRLRDSALLTGRSANIETFNILHDIRGGKQYSVIRDESAFYVFFPLSNRAKIQKFLADYLEYNKTDVKRILNLKLSNDSRAVVLRNAYPFCCISKSKILVLNIDNEN
jgi:hypothetical protein